MLKKLFVFKTSLKNSISINKFFILPFLSLIVLGCGGGSDSKKTVMCYSYQDYFNDGEIFMVLNCFSSGKCSEPEQSAFASYKNWDTCYDDMDATLSQWNAEGQPGVPTPGPNSIQENSGDSGGGSSGGSSVLKYGGYNYSYSCPTSGSKSAPIPPTVSSHCERIYERVASEIGCNNTTHYNYLMTEYQSCINKEIAACSSASPTDPNC